MNPPEFEIVKEAHKVWIQVTENGYSERERIPLQFLKWDSDKLALMLEPLARKLRKKLLAKMNR